MKLCEERYTASEGVWNLQKVMNVREGFTRKDDAFPENWFASLKAGDKTIVLMDYFGEKRITREDAEGFLESCYRARGWSVEKGSPTVEKLRELGLGNISGAW
ncbi:MAG: aldehyde ferredoxin oxidoreductase C-terminal domain-containing protein [Candidatus Freyrarchaeum guaymaensis]|nr:aldehyde ferredoxin oxidoreductase C-terminal domain-containing protein [Candidatus Sigynarchaeota archaeon]